MSITPYTFTGISKYSSDFQSIVNRTVSIAALPVQALQNDQKSLTEKKSALGDLSSAVSAMATSLTTLGNLGSGQALAVSSSSSAVSAALTTGASAGTYRIGSITSLATAAVSTSTSGWADSTSTRVSTGSDRKLDLIIDGVSHEIQLTEATDNLKGLRDAISALNLGINASFLDAGSGTNRYHLVLSAQETGAKTIELRTETGNAFSGTMSVTTAGANAQFEINGIAMTRKDNLVTDAIPGVNLRLTATTSGSETIDVKISTQSAPVTSALTTFVKNYNALSQVIDSHIGENAGVLTGDSLISDISGAMRSLTGFAGAGTVQSLADLGITLDTNGVMSFDSSAVSTVSSGRLTEIMSFLDDSGGLGELSSQFRVYSDPLTGLIRARAAGYDETSSRLSEQITTMTERINSMQETLLSKLQAADSLLSRLESQQSILTASLESLSTLTNGKKS